MQGTKEERAWGKREGFFNGDFKKSTWIKGSLIPSKTLLNNKAQLNNFSLGLMLGTCIFSKLSRSYQKIPVPLLLYFTMIRIMHKNTVLFYFALCFMTCLCWGTMLVAQTQDTLPNNPKLDNSLLFETAETQKQDAVDVVDFIKKITKIQSKSRNEQGKVHLSAFPAVGYSLLTGFAGLVDANVVFKSKKPQDNDKVSFWKVNTGLGLRQKVFWEG